MSKQNTTLETAADQQKLRSTRLLMYGCTGAAIGAIVGMALSKGRPEAYSTMQKVLGENLGIGTGTSKNFGEIVGPVATAAVTAAGISTMFGALDRKE